MSEEKQPKKRRYWIPTFVLLANAGLYLWLRQSEHMMGAGFLFISALVSAFLLWIWLTFLSGQNKIIRALCLLGGLGLIAFLATSLRYEGSTDGSGLPRFVWRWAPTLDEQSLSALGQEVQPSTQSLGGDSPAPLKYAAMDSPRFYGPNGNGVIQDLKIDRTRLAKPLAILWKQPVGLGWSGFAVQGRTAVTQEQRADDEWVSAYDLETGAQRWHYAKPRRFSEAMGGDGPRATPIIHDGTVYALGATGILDALNLADGVHQWSYDVLSEGASNLVWGKSASPLFLESEQTVIVTGGSGGAPTVQAVGAEYGNLVWSWGTDAASYASPIEATLHGQRQLVVVNENTVVGLTPETGELLWSFDWPVGMMETTAKVGQPSIIGDSQVLITASYGIGTILFKVIAEEDGSFTTETVWHSKNRMKTKFSTACVYGDHAYGLDEGIFACIDLKTGKRTWKDGRYKFGQNLLVDDILLIQAEDGDVAFVEANPKEFIELARTPGISGKTWNVPTVAGEYLLIRNDREAACLLLPLLNEATP